MLPAVMDALRGGLGPRAWAVVVCGPTTYPIPDALGSTSSQEVFLPGPEAHVVRPAGAVAVAGAVGEEAEGDGALEVGA
ncbi:hypothetical protein B7486_61985, partial [cyanobacterium TDX16]